MQRTTTILAVMALIAATAPLVGAATLEQLPSLAGGTQLMNVGFTQIPSSVRETGQYQGERVLTQNYAINFISVEVKDPTLFRARVTSDDSVLYLSNDRADAMHALLTPNDPGYSQQYGWVNTNTPKAWDTTLGTTAVTVSVVDTGILASHADFAGGRVLTGTSFVSGANQLADDNGHGTHVSGTVGANTNNGVGGAGACQCNILPVKVLDSAGSGTFANVANGITWAADHGAHIISLSLGCTAPCSDASTSNAINYARNTKGVLVVVAAGNDGGAVGFPGSDPNSFTVACTDSANAKCSFSNSGPEVAISAPGLNIYSTWNNGGYNTISGTSMSTPHVSGIAGLIKVANPSFTATDIANKIKSTAKPLGLSGMGAGLIDAGAAIGAPATPTVPGTPTLTATAGNAQVSLSWTTPTAGTQPITNYKVYRGGALLTTLGVVNSYTDTGLTNGVSYSYQVSAVNSVGEGAKSNTATATPTAPPATALSQNFDGTSYPGWTFAGLWRVGSTCLGAASPSNSLQYNSASTCKYDTGARTTGDATSPAFDISASATPTLTFNTKYTVESYSGGAYDVMQVQAKTATGAWTTLWQKDSRNAAQTAWGSVSISLGSYKSTGTQIRFHFDSVDAYSNAYAGWGVDDVVVK